VICDAAARCDEPGHIGFGYNLGAVWGIVARFAWGVGGAGNV
jgi:hypothetical protein